MDDVQNLKPWEPTWNLHILHFSMGFWGPREGIFPKTQHGHQKSKGTFFSKRFFRIFNPFIPFYGPFEFIVDLFLGLICPKKVHCTLLLFDGKLRLVAFSHYLHAVRTSMTHIFDRDLTHKKQGNEGQTPHQKKELSWLLPWEPTFHSFLGVKTHILGVLNLKPSFFMVLGSKGKNYTCSRKTHHKF